MSPKRVVLAPDLGVRDSVPKEETGGEYKPSASVFPIHRSGAVHRSFDEDSSDYGSIAPHGDAAEGCPTKPSAMPRVVLRSRHALRLPTQRLLMAEAERRHGSDTVWNGRSRSGDWIKVHWAGAKQIWWTPKDQGVVPPALVRGCWSSCHGWHRSGLVNLKSQMCELSFGLILVELLYLQQRFLASVFLVYQIIKKDFSIARFAQVERWMEKLEESETKVGFLWYEHIYKLDKDNHLGSPVAAALARFLGSHVRALNATDIGLGTVGFQILEETLPTEVALSHINIR
ncbi:RNI-like superfamily protein [Zea mays]|uniref:RNI-like superfamily protein n=1 Tax=Zea mays TaxID=4577 RepID=A0A1D6J7D8_MAIZE|nr:RNI-like superfamily protein [Zea mays]